MLLYVLQSLHDHIRSLAVAHFDCLLCKLCMCFKVWPEPYVYTHHIWPYIWWFSCQKHRTYTVYIWFWAAIFNNIPQNAQINAWTAFKSAMSLHQAFLLQQVNNQLVHDFLSQQNNRLFLFLSELMDLFVAGRDQSAADQPNNLAEGHPPL